MKRLVENYRDFIQTAQVAQEPGSFRIYGANPSLTPARAKALRRIARVCKSS